MNLKDLVAIDVHTHAWKSALQVDDKPTEQQEAMGRYFRYQPQHQTVPEMAEPVSYTHLTLPTKA